METTTLLAALGAGLAVALGGTGSSLGMGIAGAKSAGVFAEKPNLFGKLLVMMLLPGSQGIYGLLIAILIMFKAGMLGASDVVLTTAMASKFLAAGITMGLSGLFSGWYQGKVSASAIGAVARDESMMGRAIGLSVMVETYAIFGLLISVLLVMM